METESEFRTQKGYDLNKDSQVTCAMEDYLEMIYRHSEMDGYIRIGSLAALLNVKASSASKMVGNLKKAGLIAYEKYGLVRPTTEGKTLGEYLLYRHNVLNRFFCFLNHSGNELEQTERVEHFMKRHTVENVERFLNYLEQNKIPWP